MIVAKRNFILGLLCALFLSGCHKDEAVAYIQHLKQSGFTYCEPGYIKTFNPQMVDSGITVDTLSVQLFNRLLDFDPASLTPVPSLAKKWTISQDKKVYTFTLREDVSFHTTPWFTPTRHLNAQDVVFSFNRILDKNNPYHDVSGGKYPWFESMGLTQLISRVTAIDNTHVAFTLTHPDNTFLANIATRYAIISSLEYAQQRLAEKQSLKYDQFPVGTGPFKFASYKPNSEIRLIRNDQYWKEKAKMQQVVINTSPFGLGGYIKVIAGDCDIITKVNTSHLKLLQSNDNLTIKRQEGINLAYLAINTQHPLLKYQKVRQAINLAINKTNILKSVYLGSATITDTVLSPFSWAYLPEESSSLPTQRLIYAKKLLNSVNLPLKPLHLWYSPVPQNYNPNPEKMAELIQADLEKIGLSIILHSGIPQHRSRQNKKLPLDLVLTGWQPNTNEPNSFFNPLLTCAAVKGGLNYSQWCDYLFDLNVYLSQLATKPTEQQHYFNQMQGILRNQLPLIPIAHGMQLEVSNNSITGIRIGPFGILDFTSIYRRNEK